MLAFIRKHPIGVGSGAVVAVLGLAWLAFGYFGVHTLFVDDVVKKLVQMDWVMVMAAVALAIVSALAAALYPTWRACNITPAAQLRIQ